jgi:hypothetical protein
MSLDPSIISTMSLDPSMHRPFRFWTGGKRLLVEGLAGL